MAPYVSNSEGRPCLFKREEEEEEKEDDPRMGGQWRKTPRESFLLL